MARFSIDEDVPIDLAEVFRLWGHIVAHTRDIGMKKARDDQQFAYAVEHESILVVHNRKDFVLLYDGWRR